MAFVQLFGDKLLTKDGEKPTEEVLAGKNAVGVYFSAHWCPPCRGFTPKLAEMYKKTFMGKGMEIVFVSSDREQSAFNEYYGEQPWAALPYAKSDIKAALNRKFKVNGIPCLVILGPNGETITTEGREAVSEDPSGVKFPWTPPTPAEKAKSVIDAIGPDLMEKISGKPIGLYFSAHWCPPCRAFTPKLADHYKGGLKDKMEIIFISSDREKSSFDQYFGEMPWLALPYDKGDAKAALSKAFGISGLPSFVIINPDGTVITTEGRSAVDKDPSGKDFPEGWCPQPCNDVNDDPSALNEEQCVVALGESETLSKAVKQVADEYYLAAGKDIEAMPLRFFTAPQGDITEQLRKLTGLEGNKLLFIDIPSDGAFYVSNSSADAKVDFGVASTKEFINDVLAGKVERKVLKK